MCYLVVMKFSARNMQKIIMQNKQFFKALVMCAVLKIRVFTIYYMNGFRDR